MIVRMLSAGMKRAGIEISQTFHSGFIGSSSSRFSLRFMNASLSVLCLATIAGLLPPLNAAEPTPSLEPSPLVTMTLRELLGAASSTENSKKKSAPPPVPAALLSAAYELDTSGDSPRLTLQASVRNFSDEWALVSIAGDGLAFQSTGENAAPLVRRENELQVMLQAGEARELELTAPIPNLLNPGVSLQLNPVLAPRSLLTIIPGKAPLSIEVNGAILTSEDAGRMVYQIPNKAEPVRISFSKPRPHQPSRWRSRAEVLVSQEESFLTYIGHFFLNALTGSAMEAELMLPAQATDIRIEGPDLADWRLVREGNDQATVFLRWKTRDLIDRQFQVTFRLVQPPLAEEWPLATFATRHAETEATYILRIPEAADLEGEGLFLEADAARLPSWVREELGSTPFAISSGPTTTINVRWLPRVQTAPAVIAMAEHSMQVVQDGTRLTRAIYHIQHEAPFRWQIRLPAGSELLECQVDSKSAQPVQTPGNALEFHLPLSKEQRSEIQIVYTDTGDSLDPVSGSLRLALPVSDLFAREIEWDLELPEVYTIDSIESNARVMPPAAKASHHQARVQKRLNRGEPVVAELYYRQADLED